MRERERASRQRHFIFAQRYRQRGDDHVEIVCKASCTRPSSFSIAPGPSFIRPLARVEPSPIPRCGSFGGPFRPSTLVIYRAYAGDSRWNLYQRIKGRREEKYSHLSGRVYSRNAIVSIRSLARSLLAQETRDRRPRG